MVIISRKLKNELSFGLCNLFCSNVSLIHLFFIPILNFLQLLHYHSITKVRITGEIFNIILLAIILINDVIIWADMFVAGNGAQFALYSMPPRQWSANVIMSGVEHIFADYHLGRPMRTFTTLFVTITFLSQITKSYYHYGLPTTREVISDKKFQCLISLKLSS